MVRHRLVTRHANADLLVLDADQPAIRRALGAFDVPDQVVDVGDRAERFPRSRDMVCN